MGKFAKEDKWKSLTKDDLAQGGTDKFFSQVLFAGSHQLSLVNVLTGKADVAAVDDVDVAQYVELISGKRQRAGGCLHGKAGRCMLRSIPLLVPNL